MRRSSLWIGTVLGILLLSGCAARLALPYAHEIERTALMQTLGVDVGTERLDGVSVTASTGGKPPAGNQPGAAPVVLSSEADTISAACLTMQTYGEDFIFYGDVEQLLIGEGQASRGLEPLLAHMARDPELRLEAQMWVVRGGDASEVLFSAAEGGSGVSHRLEAMGADANLFSTALTRTARQAIVDMGRGGCTFLPALTLASARLGDGARGDRALAAAGYAVFRNGALAGWADGDAAHGVNLLLGRVDTDILELTSPDGCRVALKITGVKVGYAPVFENGNLTGLEVTCKVESSLAELRGAAPGLSEETRAWLKEGLVQVVRQRISAALELAQGLNADFLGLAHKAGLAAPWQWAALKEQWTAAFPTLPVSLEITGHLTRGG